MLFTWFFIFNLNEFLETNLISRTYSLILEGIGSKDILVTRGNEISIVYEDVILPINGENPFIRQGDNARYAVFRDDNGDVYLGIEAAA